jgi:predicted PurR-regulated permease PerM
VRTGTEMFEEQELARRQSEQDGLGDVARRTFTAALVAVGVVAVSLVLWRARIVVTLLFLAIIIAAAMRPGIERLHRYRIPRAVGIAIHYAALIGVLALLIWFAAPRALSQVQHAIGSVPQSNAQIAKEARTAHGLKRQLLLTLERRLSDLPSAGELVSPALNFTKKAVEIVVGVFFVFASAAYWIYERDRVERLVLSLAPSKQRRVISDTWRLVDMKLGAFVRGQLVLTLFVGTLLSLCFWLIGEPYWLLIGPFAGIVELIPVLGPLLAGILAVGVGLTVSWQVAAAAAGAVTAVRLLEDYIVVPRVLGNAVGLSPLTVLVAVAATGIVLGGVAVLLAIPVAAVLTTLVEVVLLDKDPAEADVPTLLFTAKDSSRT